MYVVFGSDGGVKYLAALPRHLELEPVLFGQLDTINCCHAEDWKLLKHWLRSTFVLFIVNMPGVVWHYSELQ